MMQTLCINWKRYIRFTTIQSLSTRIFAVDDHLSDIVFCLFCCHLQGLSSRFENERKSLDFMSKINSNTPSVGWSDSACCAFSPEMLFRQSGFDSWVVTLPLFNKKSFSLDIKLLQELARSTSIDATEAYQVGSYFNTCYICFSYKFQSLSLSKYLYEYEYSTLLANHLICY